MDIGIVTAKIDEVAYITHAENLGYSHAWVTDSPMIRSNCWAVLALAAAQTRTIRLGTGVNVPGLRLAPAAANGIAPINRIAPGRCFIGLGTGHTGMRLLVQRPMRLEPFREYIKAVRELLRGEEINYALSGETHRIRFQMLEHRFIDLKHPIPLYVAGFGPKAQALAGELGDGLVSGLPRGGTVADMLANARKGAARAGRTLPGDFHVATMVTLAMREPGEAIDSPRIVAECGAAVLSGLQLPGRPTSGDRRGSAGVRAASLEGVPRVARRVPTRDPPPAAAREPLQLPGSGRSALRHGGADQRDLPERSAGRAGREGARAGARRAATDHALSSAESSVPRHRGLRR